MSLSEIFTRIEQVARCHLFEFNQTPVTPASLVMFAVIIIAYYFVARIIRRLMIKKILPRFEIDRGNSENAVWKSLIPSVISTCGRRCMRPC